MADGIFFFISLLENVMCRDADLSVTTHPLLVPLRSLKHAQFRQSLHFFGF